MSAAPAATALPPASPTSIATLPPRAERAAALRALLGTPNTDARGLALGVRAVTHASFERHVRPLVRAHWPAVEREPFYEKLRIGACDLYASAPYTVLLCAPRRPPLVRLVTDLGNALPLPTYALAQLGGRAMRLLGRVAYADEHRRIAQVASFIMLVDHTFDHVMTEPPRERARRLTEVMHGRAAPRGPEQALTQALAQAMGAGLRDARQRRDFDAALARVEEWLAAEVRALEGVPDPRGLGHRLAGVEGGIDGLLFPVVRYAGEGARRWMYDVSLFMQIADDWLDYELDLRSGCASPVTAGVWGLGDVERAWHATVSGIEALVRDAGLRAPHYVRFVRDAYVLMLSEVLEAMIARPDA